MLIQSLSFLGGMVSAGQFLINAELMQQKSKAIQHGELSYIWALFNIWGKTPRWLSWLLPPGICLPLIVTLFFVAMASDYAFFVANTSRWENSTEPLWGSHNICPLLMQFQVSEITRLGLSTISQAEAWGDPKRPLLGMA